MGRIASILLTILLVPAVSGAQSPPATGASVAVGGDVATPTRLTIGELRAMPRSALKVTDEKGRAAAYDGVPLIEILRRAGVPNGPTLKGKALSIYVVLTARDAYQVVFSLGELDPAIGGNDALLADTIDGAPIPEAQGPLRLIVPREKENARWVRQVERIDVVQLRK